MKTALLALCLAALVPSLGHAQSLTILYPNMNGGTVGVAYSQQLLGSGGTPPYTWSWNGSIPGITLATVKSKAQFSGTPTQAGEFKFTVTVTDSASNTFSYAEDIWMAAGSSSSPSSGGSSSSGGGGSTTTTTPAPLTIPYPIMNGGTVGVAYSQQLGASGGTTPYTWSWNGAIPGITLATVSNQAQFSGTATTAGEYKFNVTVTDAKGNVYTYAEDIWFAAGSAGSGGSSTSGSGSGSSSSGSGPAPSAPAPLTIPYPVLDPGTVGTAYSKTIVGQGGVPPYTWSISAGTPVPGFNLNRATGQFTGTPTSAGEYKFTLTLTDSTGAIANAPEDVWIGGGSTGGSGSSGSSSGSGGSSSSGTSPGGTPTPLTIPWPTLDPGTVGTAYSKTIVAQGGTPPYTWSISAGNPVPGFQLNAATGQFTGTPTIAGEYVFTLTVTDSTGATAGASEDVWIGGGTSSGSSGSSSSGSSGSGSPSATYTLTVVNGTLTGGASSGSFAQGATVPITANTPPAGQYFQQWTGAPVTSAVAPSTNVTMPGSNATVTANYYSPAPIPQPVTGHPRLWITPADLPRLQSWAVPSNPVYAQGVALVIARANADYASFFPNGAPNPDYPDLGDTQGYQGLLTEEDAVALALGYLIDPNPANRITYAEHAHDILMYAFNQAALGHASNLPFRDPLFAVYNRANESGQNWPLAVDWLYNATDASGNPIFSAADKAVIRQVFLLWASDCVNAETTGGDHPSPVGATNTPSLLGANGNAYRMAANNYYLGHARLLTLMALCIDPADDPLINPVLPDSAPGNTLRSYIPNATGAWLYQEFAMFGDPAAVRAAYNLPATASVGLASGGLPPEGMLYGHSFSFLLGQLLALQTAGFNSPSLIGPQAALIGAPVWDRFVKGFTTSLVPAAQIYTSQGYGYLGPVFEMASYGDLIRLWITPDFTLPFGLLNLLDHQTNVHSRDAAETWFMVNATEGGAGALTERVSQPWSYGVMDGIIDFLVLDPTAAPAADPRPSWPTAFYDAPAGRLIAHTDWTPNATMFDYRGSWISINHQDADGGLFEFYRKGEWLTKETSNYDGVGNGQSSIWHNTLALENWSTNNPPALNWFEVPLWQNGSQWQLGLDAGDPTTATSSGSGYTFVQSDLTNLFNRPSPWTPADALIDIQAASRSVLWINGDYIVVYDRATSLHSGLFKAFNLSLVAPPQINGPVATETTPGGQSLFIQSLLPANGALSWNPLVAPTTAAPSGANILTLVAFLEPTVGRLVIQDPADPADTRFLTVLQGADPGVAMAPASLVQSTAGAAYQGAVFGATAALFPVSLGGQVASLSYSVPASVTRNFVTGLVPGAGYTVTETPSGSSIQVTVALGGPSLTDACGVLSF